MRMRAKIESIIVAIENEQSVQGTSRMRIEVLLNELRKHLEADADDLGYHARYLALREQVKHTVAVVNQLEGMIE